MSRYIVDCSVAVKWSIDEPDSEQARRLLADDDLELLAPAYILIEHANVLWKKVIRGELREEVARALVDTFPGGLIDLIPDRGLLQSAWALAIAHSISVYDGLYAAAAMSRNCQLVTADQTLRAALARMGDIHAIDPEQLPSNSQPDPAQDG